MVKLGFMVTLVTGENMYRPIGKLLLAALFVLIFAAAAGMPARAELVNLTVLHSNDTRGRITPFIGKTSKPAGGYAKRAIFFQDKRRLGKMEWLTLDAGNVFGYAPMSYYLKGSLDTRLMSMLGYDACGLGPTDFIFGRKELAARAGEAKFPFICANVKDKATGKYIGEPFKVVDLGGFRVGLLGLADTTIPAQLPPEYTAGLEFADPLATAAQWIPQLKGQCDTIILLSTLSITEDISLAIAHPEISVIVAGNHEAELQVPLKVDSTLIVESGRYGGKVGMLKLTYEGARGKGYKMRYFDEQLVDIGGAWAENSTYKTEIAAHSPRLSEQMDMVVGSLAKDMPSTKVNSFETNIGYLFADAVRASAGADVAVVEAGGFRGGLKKGPVTRGDLVRVYPGESRIIVGKMTGKDLAALLSQGASGIGRDSFLQVSGASFGIYASKAYSVAVGGTATDADDTYTVAVTERIADGIEGLTAAYALQEPKLHPYLVREAVESYLAQHADYTNELEERISYYPEPPTEENATPAPAAQAENQPNPSEPAAAALEEAPAEEAAPAENPPAEEGAAAAPDEEAAATPAEESTTPPAGEAAAAPPVTEEQPGEYEVIAEEETDTGLAPAADETAPAPDETAAAPADEPEGTAAVPGQIGTTTLDVEGLVYSLAVNHSKVEGQGAIEFVLTVKNTSDAHKMLSFPSGKHYDFKVYKEDALLWNYGYNRYYTQETGSLSLAPGEETTFRCYWDGLTNGKAGLAENLCRFVAEVSTTPVQEVSFIALFTPAEF
jgi:5'-nucleotidase/UDP-sugar diphosphatase